MLTCTRRYAIATPTFQTSTIAIIIDTSHAWQARWGQDSLGSTQKGQERTIIAAKLPSASSTAFQSGSAAFAQVFQPSRFAPEIVLSGDAALHAGEGHAIELMPAHPTRPLAEVALPILRGPHIALE
jgi:hypothetical protein